MNTIKSLYKQPLILLLTTFLFFFSCTERIAISTKDAAERLVIYGYITTDTMRHQIQITRSTGYFATTKPPAVSNATVTITTDDAVFVLTEDASRPGIYLTEPDVYGLEGKTYTLHVSLDFDGDNILEDYTSTTYLPYVGKIDSIQLRPSDNFDDYIEINFFGSLPDNVDNNYLGFRAFINNVEVNDSIQNFVVIDGEYLEGKEINNATCMHLDQEEEREVLKPGDVVTLRMDAITKEYLQFVENVQSELWGDNPVFGGPPANIQTNIYAIDSRNETPISGFFTAWSSKKKSTIYK